jgi:hypothetical protein
MRVPWDKAAMPSKCLALVALITLASSGCGYVLRSDARVRPGFHVSAVAAELSTPDAYTENPDTMLTGLPEVQDASNLRSYAEMQLGYGVDRFDVTWHAPLVSVAQKGLRR